MKAALRRALEALLGIDDTPRRVAFAFGVGLYIAFFPLFGIHGLIALGIGFAFRLSRAALLIGAYINNPWTLVPMYTAGTVLGCWILGVPVAEVWALEVPWDEGLPAMFGAVRPLLWPYLVGNTAAGLIAGTLGYQVVLRILEARAARRRP
jgi:uncharacterized protein (DUF2062 family)